MSINEEINNNQPFDVYCNSIDIAFGTYDFSISLKKVTPNGEVKLGQITMSPEHTKVFSSILSNNLAHFEELFGVIPKDDQEQIKKLNEEGKISIETRENGE